MRDNILKTKTVVRYELMSSTKKQHKIQPALRLYQPLAFIKKIKKMENYKIDLSKKWDYENGFYLTCETGRIGKFLNHLEIYKKIINLPGDVLEFGVYKGTSLIRLISFRDLFEHPNSRKIIGFDAFGKFPDELNLESDKEFVERFEMREVME